MDILMVRAINMEATEVTLKATTPNLTQVIPVTLDTPATPVTPATLSTISTLTLPVEGTTIPLADQSLTLEPTNTNNQHSRQ